MYLNCAMVDGCKDTVSHIDNKGFIYCAKHGVQRKASIPCRKLTASELKQLNSGAPIQRY